MQKCFLSLLLLAVALGSFAGGQVSGQGDDVRAAIHDVMAQLQQASEEKDAELYASVFTEDATWEGLMGQHVSGAANIRPAVQTLFSRVGPLHTEKWFVMGAPSPSMLLVALYQTRQSPASGSGDARIPNELRTILHLEKRDGRWWVQSARMSVPEQPTRFKPVR